jgi:elongation factor P--(R)-beta-lysine ligase
MNLNYEDSLENLAAGTWYARIIRNDLDDRPGQILLIEDREYFFPASEPDILLKEGSWVKLVIDECGNKDLQLLQEARAPILSYGDGLRWRRPGQMPSRISILKTRHKLLLETRKWFDEEGFIETETPLLVHGPSPESQFSLMRVQSEYQKHSGDLKKNPDYLITSPEFQMKRMLVGGFENIFQICRCFRNGEIGPLHHPEFTMLEWYRAHSSLEDLMDDLSRLCSYLSEKIPGLVKLTEKSWPRFKVRDLFGEKTGICLTGMETPKELLNLIMQCEMKSFLEDQATSRVNQNNLTYESIFFRIWDQIEPDLGKECPIWVSDWPLPLASLAKPLSDSPGFADRVECYANGMELANGFGELTDPEEQRRRFEKDLQNRKNLSRPTVPLDEKFLQSLEEGMPPSSGMALGFDRLLLLLTGTQEIRQTLAFSWEEL